MDGCKVYKLRIRGNYDALCQKLGQELQQEIYSEHIQKIQEGRAPENASEEFVQALEQRLSPPQLRLFNICRGMNFKNYTCRPTWAGGAHIFVTPAVADEVEDAFEGVELGKSDVVVSPEHLAVVLEALAEGSGSRRSCAYVNESLSTAHPLRVFSAVDAKMAFTSLDPLSFWPGFEAWVQSSSLDIVEAASEHAD